jgi:hypothetical protein
LLDDASVHGESTLNRVVGVKITVEAGETLGDQTGFAQLKVRDCPIPSVHLPIRWRVRDLVVVAPTRLYLQPRNGDRPSSGRIIVSSEKDTSLDIGEAVASSAPGDFDLELQRLRGNMFAVNVIWRHPAGPGNYHDCITIRCREPIATTIDVPVTAYVGEANQDP